MKKFKIILPVFLIALLVGCGKGIEPQPEVPLAEKPGFSGTITFIGEWDSAITRTHIVVFQDPLNSAADFNAFNLRFVSREIPFGTEIYNYTSLDSPFVEIPAGEFAYVAVAQSKAVDISLDRTAWFVAGVYYADRDTTQPGRLIIPDKTVVPGINIICDFNNPPPQPPGGN
jgi:hypothetical protein